MITCSALWSTEMHWLFPNDKILDSSKLKVFADDNIKLDENGRKVLLTGRKYCRKRRNCFNKKDLQTTILSLMKMEERKVLRMGRKHCGKRRNCSLRAISSFPTVFSKYLNYRYGKTRACLGKGKISFSKSKAQFDNNYSMATDQCRFQILPQQGWEPTKLHERKLNRDQSCRNVYEKSGSISSGRLAAV